MGWYERQISNDDNVPAHADDYGATTDALRPYTPGPWVSRDTDEGDWVVDMPDRPSNTVSQLWFGDMETNTGEDIANANLIAAAPDLLAACQAALGHMEDHNPELSACDTCVAVVHALGVAIAKARGA